MAALADRGVEAAAFTADVTDHEQVRGVVATATERFGGLDVAYYGPAAIDPDVRVRDIAEIDADEVRRSMESVVYPAIHVVNAVLPAMIERGDGALLFAGGLSGQVPMPALGSVALPSAALRNYALTLHAGLAPKGVYAGTLTVGGLIDRGDIHRFVTGRPELFGDIGLMTLNPDEIADEAWGMYAKRDRAESTFSAFA